MGCGIGFGADSSFFFFAWLLRVFSAVVAAAFFFFLFVGVWPDRPRGADCVWRSATSAASGGAGAEYSQALRLPFWSSSSPSVRAS